MKQSEKHDTKSITSKMSSKIRIPDVQNAGEPSEWLTLNPEFTLTVK